MSQTVKTDEEILQDIKNGISGIAAGFQSYTGPAGETYTKANLSDLLKLEKFYENKITAGKSGGVKTSQVIFKF